MELRRNLKNTQLSLLASPVWHSVPLSEETLIPQLLNIPSILAKISLYPVTLWGGGRHGGVQRLEQKHNIKTRFPLGGTEF